MVMDISGTYNITFDVQDVTKTPDNNLGGFTDVWANVLSSVPGRMRQLNGSEVSSNEKKGFKSSHRFYCDYTATIIAGQQIIYNSEIYKITAPPDNPHNLNAFLQIDTLKNQ